MVTLTLQNMELPKIWDLEVLDIKDPVERKNKTLLEEETLIHFKETIKVGEDQRYEVSLPWLAGHPPVYDMYDAAESILRSVLRFCHNLKVNSHKLRKELTFQDIQIAEEAVIRIIQAKWSSKMQEKYSKTIQFYEENKILKVRARLILGEDAEDFVRPTVLPYHPIVRRLIEYTHKTLYQVGVQTTLSHLRERFWIPRGRRIVREVLHKFLTCKRYILQNP
ncbi:integrase_H2C2 domain-containing protein [Trichonephila clavata]|uniref:Integrase_H2C2 domain-containing protein n=1 Tax=Trichonephila clavata TaxID=2740835 RepID=A0A8X6IL69_TRICU|nr:integrase_H2C2 domain-containing protein [Trichonephila clavata]